MPSKPLVVTSIRPLGSLIRNISGTRMQVETLTPYGHDGVARSLGDGDRNFVKFASAGFFSGLGYDNELGAAVRDALPPEAPVIYLGPVAITAEALTAESDPAGQEPGAAVNPFVWTDPVLGKSYAVLIKQELSRIDPAGAAEYGENYEKVASALDRLDRAISDTISTIPVSARSLFTEVNAFDYFAERYGLKAIGSIRRYGDATEKNGALSPSRIRELAELVRSSGTAAVFATDGRVSPELNLVARDAGVRSIGVLRYEELPGPPGSLGYTYFGLVIDNARNIAGHLGGDTEPLAQARPNDVVQI